MSLSPTPAAITTPTIDWSNILQQAQAIPTPDRLPWLLLQAGAQPHPEDPRLIASAGVRLWTIGGLPCTELQAHGFSLPYIATLTQQSMGTAGAMSYLSLPGGTPSTAYEKIAVNLGHTSCAHLTQVSLIIAGISCSVANEFNSQRDLIHCARVTEARALAQSNPMLVVLDKALIPIASNILNFTQQQLTQARTLIPPGPDAHEAINTLFPSSKATALVLTATLRNLQKLLSSSLTDPGKEQEYRSVLQTIHHTLHTVWPELFPLKTHAASSSNNATPSPAQQPLSNLEQHWVTPSFQPLLAHLPLHQQPILEFGAGTGNLTTYLLQQNAPHVEAWELDPTLAHPSHPNLTWLTKNIADATPSDLHNKALVCFPPYSLLPHIEKLAQHTSNAVLMVPPKRLVPLLSSGWRLLGSLNGSDFSPPSSGTHFIIAKGYPATSPLP